MRFGPDVVVLVEDALVGDAEPGWNTPWVSWPATLTSAQLTVVCKAFVGAGTPTLGLQASWDTDRSILAGPTILVTAVGVYQADMTDMGPFVRLGLAPVDDTKLMISAYLSPKRS